MEKNLTNGSVLKNILYFSLPYLFSYFLQTLYGMADLFITGQFGGVADITSVTIGSQGMHMITVMIVGLAMGTTVTISRAVGGNDREKASQSIGNTISLFMIVSILLSVVLFFSADLIVKLLSTPTEAVSGTRAYLRICFVGIPAITAYNILSSIFRGMGDSKSPMYFIAVACVANIVLDYVFIGIFNMVPTGAALGTTLSQALSVAVALFCILKKDMGIHITRGDFVPKKETMGEILKIGLPVAFQDGFIQISFLVITIIANRRGLNDSAAVGIVEKLIGIFFLVHSSMLSAVSALAAQNLGANKPERAKLTLRYASFITVGFGIVIAVACQFFATQFVGIFEDDSAVKLLGSQYLKSYSFDCIVAGIHFCFSGYFCALGKSGISFLHNLLSILLARIPLAYLASLMFPDTLFPMGCAAPIGSAISVVVCIVAYGVIERKNKLSHN